MKPAELIAKLQDVENMYEDGLITESKFSLKTGTLCLQFLKANYPDEVATV